MYVIEAYLSTFASFILITRFILKSMDKICHAQNSNQSIVRKCWLIEIGASARRRWSSRFSSPRVITGVRQLRTILFGGLGLGLRVGVLGVVRVWVRVMVSIRVRVGVA